MEVSEFFDERMVSAALRVSEHFCRAGAAPVAPSKPYDPAAWRRNGGCAAVWLQTLVMRTGSDELAAGALLQRMRHPAGRAAQRKQYKGCAWRQLQAAFGGNQRVVQARVLAGLRMDGL